MTALKDCLLSLSPILLACGVLLTVGASSAAAQAPAKPAPTHKDFSYGPHPSNVFDLWLAESPTPTPLVLFIHGGGFRGGSKNSLPAPALRELLDAGISVAAIEYRVISHAKLPAAHHDCRRALQLLRAKANEWNIDKTRVGAFGGSAGAQICMWLAFHDDMADPESDDPIERESTRLTCVATNGGQTTMDFDWWMKHIPGYDTPHRDPHESFDAKDEAQLRKIVAEVSALSLISADDPPIHMQYGQNPADPVPPDPQQAQGWKVHHVTFGIKLKEKMDELGVEANLQYPRAPAGPYESREDFFIAKLTGKQQ
jgi:acetyl esterase/lipase